MKKRMLAAVLAAAMLGSMVTGCNVGKGGDTEKKDESNGDSITLDFFNDFSWYHSDNWEGIIPDAITEATGIGLDVTRASDASQLGLLIASGELPDIIWTNSEISRLSDSNLCYSYNELIEKYKIDWEPNKERIAIAQKQNAKEEDENYYSIIQNYNTSEEWAEFESGVPNIPGLYYRKDIWEALGSPEMNTTDQIKDVLAMVKDKYPELQVICAGSPDWRLKGFGNWFGIPTAGFVYNEDGEAALYDTTEANYEYWKMLNEFYRQGYFKEENLALENESDSAQIAYNGDCFINEWNARPTQLDELNTKTQANVEGAEWAYLPIPDDSKEIPYASAGFSGLFISKNCKDPEAAIKLIAYLNSEEGQKLSMWGREGIDYEMGENNIPEFSDEWTETNKDSQKMAELFNTNYFATTELHELKQYYSGRSQEELDNFGKNSDKVHNYPELSLAKPNSTTDEGIINAKIDEARKAERVKIWTAPSSEAFEKEYDAYMKLLDKMGVNELNEYANKSVKDVAGIFAD